MTENSDTVANGAKKATFGAGCFWGIEATFRGVPGVIDAPVGYSGGAVAEPSYEQVCTGRTGHAEVVEVEYDPEKVGYDELLEVFWRNHDSTQKNRQGPDVGTQYRSAIFYHDEDQKRLAEETRAALETRFDRKIATQIVSAGRFWKAA